MVSFQPFMSFLGLAMFGTPRGRRLVLNNPRGDEGTALPYNLLIESDDLLIRERDFPNLSRASLEKAVQLDAKRASPFENDKVHIAYRVLSKSGGTLTVRQYMMRASDILRVRQKFATRGLHLRTIAPKDAPGSLLADYTADLMRPTAPWRKLNIIMLVPLILLIIANAYLSLKTVQEERDMATAQVAKLQDEAKKLNAYLSDTADSASGLRQATDRHAQNANILTVVDRVTAALPDTAWVSLLRFDHNALYISGNATADIVALQDSIRAEPIFGAPVLHSSFAVNGSSDEQRFEIEIPVLEVTQ